MRKFNLNLLNNSVIRCRNEKQAKEFVTYLDELRGSKSPNLCWNDEFTCYSVGKNFTWKYCDVSFYKARGFKILDFEDCLENTYEIR